MQTIQLTNSMGLQNWPRWKRDRTLFVLSLISVIATTLSPLLSANTLLLAAHFDRTFTDIALLTGYHLLGVGVAGILSVPTARVWGKRHLYILGAVVVVLSSVWAGASGTNYHSLLWARIFQGVGLAPFEALVNASVGDLYFVHERGGRMAVSNLAVFGGAFFTPVVAGKMTYAIGWEWTFYFVAIFAGLLLPFVVVYVPETAYRRPAHLNTDMDVVLGGIATARRDEMELEGGVAKPGSSNSASGELEKPSTGTSTEGLRPGTGNNTVSPSPAPQPPPATFAQTLRLFNGRKTDEDFWKLLVRPFPLFLHPAILWGCLIQGALIGWTVLIGIIIAAVLIGPALNFSFSEVEVGYMYTGPFIGALLGFVVAGLMADSSAKWLTKRNGGVYEPEFRLVLVAPQLLFGVAGLYGFGIVSEEIRRFGWFWLAFFFALEVMAMVIGAVASALYIVDAHRRCFLAGAAFFSASLSAPGLRRPSQAPDSILRALPFHFSPHSSAPLPLPNHKPLIRLQLTNPTGDIAIEAFTCLLVFKNLFSFGLTWFGFDWLVEYGPKRMFLIVGSIQVVVCMTTVVLCMWISLASVSAPGRTGVVMGYATFAFLIMEVLFWTFSYLFVLAVLWTFFRVSSSFCCLRILFPYSSSLFTSPASLSLFSHTPFMNLSNESPANNRLYFALNRRPG